MHQRCRCFCLLLWKQFWNSRPKTFINIDRKHQDIWYKRGLRMYPHVMFPVTKEKLLCHQNMFSMFICSQMKEMPNLAFPHSRLASLLHCARGSGLLSPTPQNVTWIKHSACLFRIKSYRSQWDLVSGSKLFRNVVFVQGKGAQHHHVAPVSNCSQMSSF